MYEDLTQDLQKSFPALELHQGLPDVQALQLTLNVKSKKLLLIDDLSDKFFKSEAMLDIFHVKSHHANISLCVTTQNIFLKETKPFLRNASERIFFYDKVDENYLSILSSQMKVGSPSFLLDCFNSLFCISKKGKNLQFMFSKIKF